jgi:hypothetical protein
MANAIRSIEARPIGTAALDIDDDTFQLVNPRSISKKDAWQLLPPKPKSHPASCESASTYEWTSFSRDPTAITPHIWAVEQRDQATHLACQRSP